MQMTMFGSLLIFLWFFGHCINSSQVYLLDKSRDGFTKVDLVPFSGIQECLAACNQNLDCEAMAVVSAGNGPHKMDCFHRTGNGTITLSSNVNVYKKVQAPKYRKRFELPTGKPQLTSTQPPTTQPPTTQPPTITTTLPPTATQPPTTQPPTTATTQPPTKTQPPTTQSPTTTEPPTTQPPTTTQPPITTEPPTTRLPTTTTTQPPKTTTTVRTNNDKEDDDDD